MDEFIKENEETVASESVCENVAEENQNNIGEDIPQVENTETVETSASGESFSEKTETTPYYSQPAENHTSENFAPVYNPINYTPVQVVNDYKPMSKGLKLFAVIMAAIILLTGTTYAGYVIGKNSTMFTSTNSKVKVDLESKPADSDELTPAPQALRHLCRSSARSHSVRSSSKACSRCSGRSCASRYSAD